jgi:hypothetical protein
VKRCAFRLGSDPQLPDLALGARYCFCATVLLSLPFITLVGRCCNCMVHLFTGSVASINPSDNYLALMIVCVCVVVAVVVVVVSVTYRAASTAAL